MAVPRLRYDGYGAPLPHLTDARQESLLERPVNRAQRDAIRSYLEEVYRTVLCRGTHARVVLDFAVQDGLIQSDMHVSVTTHHRTLPEEP